ncbi:hypothetical protein OOT46_14000 [Aquabacterium sp. A7-Y]|uniref:hypothetical protein n=1 Tax=Aquabacterium sp. A7-Y TaxID=1349605 RepID=UPI00223CB848|nr:hypothetical protein [Aquabacterium sp. A7-Y]MCW7538954.1 hypothetical protein [Aquabacterium sp. A7-Y]
MSSNGPSGRGRFGRLEMRALILATCAFLSACTHSVALPSPLFEEVFVKDFESSEPARRCRASDVNLDHARAGAFFRRAREVDSRTLHDNYDIAPCRVLGTLKYQGQTCDWSVDAGATGWVRCADRRWLFACDDCKDLLETDSQR